MKAPTSEMIELVNPMSELQEAVMLKTVQEGGINESDDNDLSSQTDIRLYIPSDGKSVEDKLKQCIGYDDRREHAYGKGTKVCSKEHQ
jgi:hypothetical protein